MPTISGLFSATGPVTIAVRPSARAAAATPSASTSGQYGDMKQIYRRVLELNRAVAEAARALDRVGGRSSTASPARTSSADPLGLDLTPEYSIIGSTAELNTIATSYSPFGPSWTKTSTSPTTAGGIYSGTDDRLRFYVTSSNATVGGSRSISIRMYDLNGTRNRQTMTWAAYAPPGTTKTYLNGIQISLGAGTVNRTDDFWVDVWSTRDSEVDPSKPLNGTRNSDPNLQPGLDVVDGSFAVNGTVIPITASDSLDTVIGAISASDAGVSASYDAVTERVGLTMNEADDTPITLTGDTSGFLAAAKLTTAVSTEGSTFGELTRSMDEVGSLAGVAAGALVVNGTEVAIDPANDSLDDILERIGGAVPGVTTEFDHDTQRVTLTTGPAGTLTLQDGGTGFLAEVGLAEGTFQGRSRAQVSGLAARRATAALTEVQRALERIWDLEVSDTAAGRALDSVRSRIGQALTQGLGDSGAALAAAGLEIDPDADPGDRVMRMAAAHFDRALRGSHSAELREILGGSPYDRTDGLLGVLSTASEALEGSLDATCGSLGVYLDTRA